MIQATTPNDDMQLYTYDREYYWDFLTFSIGSHLFRVPKLRFVEASETFCELHSIKPTTSDGGLDPVRIPLDVSVADFQGFLHALYPRTGDRVVNLPKEGWISVLKLSTLWFFNDLRKVAIEKLAAAKMNAIERICLAKQYNIPSMLLSSYSEVVQECEGISVEEAVRMDAEKETALHLSRIMIRRLRSASSRTVEEDIEFTFSVEFEKVRQREHDYLPAAEKARIAEEKARLEEEERQREKEQMEKKAREEAERLKVMAEREKRERASKLLEEEKMSLAEEEAKILAEEERLQERKRCLQARKEPIPSSPPAVFGCVDWGFPARPILADDNRGSALVGSKKATRKKY